jgi:DNA gyrase/topoisomerase IV subunit A
VTGKGKHRQEVDLEQVGKLVEALERDLENIRSDSTAVQRLKDEVQTLKNVLGSPVRRHHWVRDGLQSIRDVFETARDTAVADGLKGGQYLAEIGRILGM